MQITFEIAVLDYDLIELRWPVALGKTGSAAYQALADSLEPITGVNRVEVLRYSAHIEIAEHVENLASVMTEIQETLLDDEHLAVELSSVGVTNYGVTVFPGVVTRRSAP